MWWSPAAWSLQRRHGNGLFHTPTLTTVPDDGQGGQAACGLPSCDGDCGAF